MLAGHNDPTVEKNPPRAATKISFPDIRPLVNLQTKPWTETDHPDIVKVLTDSTEAVRGKAIDKLIWTTVNVNFKSEVNVSKLIESSAAKDFLPPLSWMNPPTDEAEEIEVNIQAMADGDIPTLHNKRDWPNREDYWDRIQDLMYSNEEAYHGLRRTAEDGKEAPRVTHGRPFFIALDEMGQYWDSSLDQYIKMPEDWNDDAPKEFTKEPNGSGGSYRGYRVGMGQDMPPKLRFNVVKALVELAMYPFAFIIPAFENNAAHSNKYLEIRNLRICIPELTRRMWRVPALTAKARSGMGQGPILGLSLRDGFLFSTGHWDGPKDLMRETACLFILAQERARHGKTETWPGEGKFWKTRKRFAGHQYRVPGEYLLDDDEMEILCTLKDDESHAREHESRLKTKAATQAATKKRREYEQYLRSIMTPRQRSIHRYKYSKSRTSSLWEAKADYIHIGKDKDSKYDDIFLVSALNHHVSILKLHVHEAYLTYLENGKVPANAAFLAEDWSEPVVERSRWYNLFDTDDRIYVFRALWAIAGYMARPRT
jgi:hypothetical protein